MSIHVDFTHAFYTHTHTHTYARVHIKRKKLLNVIKNISNFQNFPDNMLYYN